MALVLNGSTRVLSARLVIPWRGVWIADLDLDPGPDGSGQVQVPSGAVTLTIGSQALVGAVDPRYSGRFVRSVRLRVVGGGGGWDKATPPQDFHNDAGVLSSEVYEATASQAGEKIMDLSPVRLASHYVRSAGPASQVFGTRDWYVGLDGVTQVSSRPTATADKSFEILSFDPQSSRIEATSDVVILPGTTLQDARFDGTLTVRDVEQNFTPEGSRATLWCSTGSVSRLTAALSNMVRVMSGQAYLKVYPYRYVSATADRLNLQAVDKAAGFPDVLPVPVYPGMAGLSAKLTPSQTVLVAFLEGDPQQPVVVGFDGNLPEEVTIDATSEVHVGPSAQTVSLAGGSNPVARVGDQIQVFLPPALAVVGTLSGSPFTGTITVANPISGVIVQGSDATKTK